MNPTGCHRCVAERRARWVAAAIDVGAGTAVLTLAAVGCLVSVMSRAMNHGGEALLLLVGWAEAFAPFVFVFALAVPCLVLALSAILRRLTRVASVPLPPPADPLATYREAPVECPWHPLAR